MIAPSIDIQASEEPSSPSPVSDGFDLLDKEELDAFIEIMHKAYDEQDKAIEEAWAAKRTSDQ